MGNEKREVIEKGKQRGKREREREDRVRERERERDDDVTAGVLYFEGQHVQICGGPSMTHLN